MTAKNIYINIDLIDNWINKTLKSYNKIIIDISNIQKNLITIKIETSNIYEYIKIKERSLILLNMLLPIIKK